VGQHQGILPGLHAKNSAKPDRSCHHPDVAKKKENAPVYGNVETEGESEE
jgi:hypothetical protein